MTLTILCWIWKSAVVLNQTFLYECEEALSIKRAKLSPHNVTNKLSLRSRVNFKLLPDYEACVTVSRLYYPSLKAALMTRKDTTSVGSVYDPRHRRKQMLIASLWVVISLVILRLSTAIKSAFISRYFTKEEVGVISVIVLLHVAIKAFTEMGHESALIQRRDEGIKRAINTAWVGAIIRGFALCVVLALAAPYLSEFYRAPLLTPMIQASALYFLIVGFRDLHQVMLIREMSFSKPKMIGALAGVIELGVTLFVGLYYQTIWCVVIGGICLHLFQTIASFFISPKGLKLEFSYSDFKELFRFGVHIQIISILVFLVSQLDNIVIGRTLSLEQLAIYANAYLLANLPSTQVISTATQVTYPMWSRVVREGGTELRAQMFLNTVRLTMSLCLAISLGLYIGGGDLIELIFGPGWREAERPFKILLLFSLWRALGSTCSPLFKAIGKPQVVTIEIALKSLFVALLIYPMTERYGLIGASWAVTLPMALITPWALIRYFRLAEVSVSSVTKTLQLPVLLCSMSMILWLAAETYELTPRGLFARGFLLPSVIIIGILALQISLDPQLRAIIRFKGQT